MTWRALRWTAAVAVGVGGFALAWWVAEGVLKLDRPSAVSLAAVAGPLLAAPLIWYARREPGGAEPAALPRDTSQQPTTDTSPPEGVGQRAIEWRWVIVPAAALAVGLAVGLGYQALSRLRPEQPVADQAVETVESGSPSPQASQAPASAAPASSAPPPASQTAKPCTPKPTTVAGQTRAATIAGRGVEVAVNHTGKQVAISNNDQVVLLYEVSQPGCPVRTGRLAAPGNAGRLSFSPVRNLLALSNYTGGKGMVTLYDTTSLSSPKKIGSFEGGSSVFNASGKLMAFGSTGNTSVLVDVSTPSSPVRGATVGGSGEVEFSPARDLLATIDLGAGGYGTAVNLYSVANPAGPAKLATITHGHQPFAVAFSSNAQLLAIATWQKTVTLWNIANPAAPALVATLTGFAEMVTDLAFSPTRATLATVSIGTLNLWGVSTPASPSRIAQIPDNGSGLAFQPQGGFLVSAGDNTHLYTFG